MLLITYKVLGKVLYLHKKEILIGIIFLTYTAVISDLTRAVIFDLLNIFGVRKVKKSDKFSKSDFDFQELEFSWLKIKNLKFFVTQFENEDLLSH